MVVMKCLRQPVLWLLFLTLSPVLQGQVVINEIMYHPSSHLTTEEYIELYNAGNTNVTLSNWRFSRGIDFTFTNQTTLAPGQYLVVAADVAVFQAKYPTVANVTGNWSGSLANSGETVELEDGNGNRILPSHPYNKSARHDRPPDRSVVAYGNQQSKFTHVTSKKYLLVQYSSSLSCRSLDSRYCYNNGKYLTR